MIQPSQGADRIRNLAWTKPTWLNTASGLRRLMRSMDSPLYPEGYGSPTGTYVVEPTEFQNNGMTHKAWLVKRKGTGTSDGGLYLSKAWAVRQAKTYESLEYMTGQVRISTGQWWPGVPFIKPQDRTLLGHQDYRNIK